MLREQAAGHELVAKPLFGCQGEGLLRLAAGEALPDAERFGGVYYLQRFMATSGPTWHDWRVFVIGGAAVAAMQRHGCSWINNVARGARCQPVELDAAFAGLAEAAVAALHMDYAGVDIMRDADGRATILEVNSIPAWSGLQSVCEVDIAGLLAADVMQKAAERTRLRAAG